MHGETVKLAGNPPFLVLLVGGIAVGSKMSSVCCGFM